MATKSSKRIGAQDRKNQLNLPFKVEFPEPTRNSPRLWMRNIALYEKWDSAELIRQIPFTPGLNIVQAKSGVQGAPGHAAGKSTLCRLIRYALGEAGFGTEEFEHAFRTQFPSSWVVAEVFIDDALWLVARPTGFSNDAPWCAHEASLEKAFEEALEHLSYKNFLDAIESAFLEPLKFGCFPGSEKEITWPHLLSLISRDQNTRYAHLLTWRTGNGVGDDSGLGSDHKTNLVRLILGGINEAEVSRIDCHQELLKGQRKLETEGPKIRYAKERLLEEIGPKTKTQLTADGDLGMELGILTKTAMADSKRIETTATALAKLDGVNDADKEKLNKLTAQVADFDSKINEVKERLARRESQFRFEKGEINEEQHRKDLAELGAIKGLCSATIEDAINASCPLAPMSDRDEIAASKLAKMQTKAQRLEFQIGTEKATLKRERSARTRVTTEKTALEKTIEDQREKHTALIAKTYREKGVAEQLAASCQMVLKLFNEDEKNREELKKTKNDVEESRKLLSEFRDDERDVVSKLSSVLSSVASTMLLKEDIRAEVRVQLKSIDVTIDYQGDQDSAALSTLRILLFDIATLLVGFPHHPGLLIHDSPREADLAPEIYRRIFEFMAERSSLKHVPFQYIITTTEPPPKACDEKWTKCTISSAEPKDRLMGAVFS